MNSRPPPTCIACNGNAEARPGARLCRSCLEVAGVILEAIRAEESRWALMVRPTQ